MTSSKWTVYAKKADFDAIGKEFNISPITARIIRNRDVCGNEAIGRYLNGTWKDLYSPYLLNDAEKAADILLDDIRSGEKIRIVGDYDVDGVCSTYLFYKALERLGADVDYDIPDRIKDGYGINENIVRKAAMDGVDLILTCDNGISAISQLKLASELGMDVIVTDHHQITSEDGRDVLPEALAVVNPHRTDCDYPFKEICGAFVSYKVIQILYEKAGIPVEEWTDMMEFAALGTVCDVMPLLDENRILVKEGLKRMPRTKSLGLRKLIDKAGLDIDHITSENLGFVIGPCINSGGRLKNAKFVLQLFLSSDEHEADELALELKMLNDERKDMSAKETAKAKLQVEEYYQNDNVIVAFLPDCHESLAGIVAGNLKEAYNKPAFVLTCAEEGIKGSGRSIEAYPMFEALTEVKDLLTRFGGHPMAAGLSLPEENIEEFRRRLNDNARLKDEDFNSKVWIDVPMPLEYITEELIEELDILEPFGEANEKPKFAQKDLMIRSARVVGKNRNAVKFSFISPNGLPMNGIMFADGDEFMEEMGDSKTMDVIYYPRIDEFNGNRSIEIEVEDYRFH